MCIAFRKVLSVYTVNYYFILFVFVVFKLIVN